MADYRLSAQVIKRSDGKSSVASAAYRAAERLEDLRTGEIHNYAPKGGVDHAQILAPNNTPSWMLNREDLWNAVEKIERRKDAQLAREIQLSLPHELTPEQRRELVLEFAQEQFVNNGMIADIAVHSPNPKGDERNHHAHIMLTMRELTSDGFGKKNRDWNSRETVNRWREEWATHQNRTLEHFGHDARVDHRSLENQGVDREPQMHLGVIATEMERNGKSSRRGDENRAMNDRNSELAKQQAEAARIAAEITKEKAKLQEQQRKEQEAQKQQQHNKMKDLKWAQELKRKNLERDLKAKYHERKIIEQRKMLELRQKVESARGIKKVFRDLSGITSRDAKNHNELRRSLLTVRSEEQTARQNLDMKLSRERERERERQEKLKQELVGKQQRDRDEFDRKNGLKSRDQKQDNAISQQRIRQDQPAPKPRPPRGAAPSKSWMRPDENNEQSKTQEHLKAPNRDEPQKEATRSWMKSPPQEKTQKKPFHSKEQERDKEKSQPAPSNEKRSWKTNSQQIANEQSYEKKSEPTKQSKDVKTKRSWQQATVSNDNKPSQDPQPPRDRGRDRDL